MYQGKTASYHLGQGGFNGSDNIDLIPPYDLREASNVRYDGNVIRKAGGLTLYDSNAISGTPTCLSGIDWWPTTSIQKQVTAWTNGKVYKEVSGDLDSVELGTGFTFTQPVHLVPCGQEIPSNNRKLLLFSQGINPQILNANGTSLSALTYLNADWTGINMPGAAIMHDNRVVAFLNPSSPHSIYFSALDDHTNFLASDPLNASSYPLPAFDIQPGEGEYINALHSIGNTRLYVFKYPTGLYYIDTDNMTSFVAPVTTVRKDIGIAGAKAVTKAGDLGTWFIGSDGHVYSLEAVSDPNIDPKAACLTRAKWLNRWIKENVLPSRLQHAILIHDSNRGEVWAIYTKIGSSYNNIALVFDINDPMNVKISVEERGTYFNAAWLTKESAQYRELYVGGTGGVIYKANQSSRKIGTATGYLARFRTPDSDLSWVDPQLALVDKRYDFLEIRALTTGTGPIAVDLFIDNALYNTYNFDFSSTGSPLDDITYGLTPNTVKSPFTLAGDGYSRQRLKIGGYGRRISFRVYNSASNEDFGVSSMILYFDTLGSGGEI